MKKIKKNSKFKNYILKLLRDIVNSEFLNNMNKDSFVPKNSPRKSFAIRSKFVVIAVAVLFSLCIFQLAKIQIIDAQKYKTKAQENQLYDAIVPAKRGAILDKNGDVLAQSADVWKVYVDPFNAKDSELRTQIGTDLSKVLDLPLEKVNDVLLKSKFRHIILKKNVEYNTKQKILELRDKKYKYTDDETGEETWVKGRYVIGIEPDVKRYYPNSDLASHILGYTNSDGVGSGGVELYYNSELTGVPGRIVTAQNAYSEMMPLQYRTIYDAKQGENIVLTLDKNIQLYLEKALEQAYIDNKCASANGIVMDVNTGAILAMATKGSFDPNNPRDVDEGEVQAELKKIIANQTELNKKNKIELSDKQQKEFEEKAYSQAFSNVMSRKMRNINVSDTYEPGSVFKTITACAALEEGVATPQTKVECKPGGITIDGSTYHCANHNVHGVLDMTGGLNKSCNSYFITMGQKVGTKAFAKYFEAFGFTERTGIDLPAEAKPVEGVTYHKLSSMTKVNLASSSFGQSFQVTPIQMVTALSAIANGGKLMKPYIVAETKDAKGKVLSQTKPLVRRQVISQHTSETVAEMMRSVVNDGTAKNGYVAGYRVAGKTGTSQKLSKKGEYIASYGCFAPSDDAKIAVIIMIDEPHGGQIHGGQIAAPVAARVVEDTLKYMNVEPRYSEKEIEKLDTAIGDFRGKNPAEVKRELVSKGFNCKILGNGNKVLDHLPGPYQTVPQGGIVVIYTQNESASTKTTVPDFTNLTLTQANQRAAAFGLNVKISGNTLVNSELIAYGQDTKAGKSVNYGSTVTVYFKSNTGVSDIDD